MVQIVGTYQHVSNSPDFEEFLKSQGAPDAIVKPIVDSKPVVTISLETGDTWEIKVQNAGKESKTTFKLGEPYDETMPHGVVFKSVTTREGDKFIINSTSADGKTGIRVYEFSDAGFTVYLSDEKSGKKVSRVYKRL